MIEMYGVRECKRCVAQWVRGFRRGDEEGEAVRQVVGLVMQRNRRGLSVHYAVWGSRRLRCRVGNRVLYRINEDRSQVVVLRTDHRGRQSRPVRPLVSGRRSKHALTRTRREDPREARSLRDARVGGRQSRGQIPF